MTMTNIPPVTAVATVNGRRRPGDLPLLQWWRGERPEQRDPPEPAMLHAMLSRIALISHRDWNAAVQGDVSASVSAALRVDATRAGLPDWCPECAGSAILLGAIASDAAVKLRKEV